MIESCDLMIPLKGGRDYIGGVDFVVEALRLLRQEGWPIRDINLSCYRMVNQSHVSMRVAREPLSAKTNDAVLQLTIADRLYYFGFSPAAADLQVERVPCPEKEQLNWVAVGERHAQVSRPVGLHAPLITMLVAAIKASSAKSFPNRRGKWIFAQCRLKLLPDDWETAIVRTEATENARFFDWSVSVDNESLGKIVFFVDEPKAA